MRYKGMTLIGMVLTLAIVGTVGIVIMRVVPVYLDYYEVSNSISALEKIPATEFSGDPAANASVLRDRLINQLYVNSIELPPEDISITPNENGNFQVRIKYKVIKHLFGNMSLLFEFDKSQEVKLGDR